MDAKYNLLPFWLVSVECEIWPATKDGRKLKIKWHFDFSVVNTMLWLEIRKIARRMMNQQFAKEYEWKMIKISLTTSTGG